MTNQNRLIVILFAFAYLFHSRSLQSEPKTPLKFSYLESNEAPFIDDPISPKRGILIDIAKEISKKLALPYTFIPSSRKRIEGEILKGNIHLNCFLNKKWVKNPEEIDFTTTPNFSHENRLIVKKASKFADAKTFKELKGARIGTLRGYYYHPQVMALFKKGEAKRESVNTSYQNLKMLELSRIDGFIMSKITYSYLQEEKHHYKELSLNFSKTNIYCAVSKKSPVKSSTIDSVVKTLDKDGTLLKIINSY